MNICASACACTRVCMCVNVCVCVCNLSALYFLRFYPDIVLPFSKEELDDPVTVDNASKLFSLTW